MAKVPNGFARPEVIQAVRACSFRGIGLKPLTIAEVSKIIFYNRCSGQFIWKVVRCGSAMPGMVAGSLDKDGYRRINIYGRRYAAHRLAWFISYGKWPEIDIDHINMLKDDNRISNLRLATKSQNKGNSTSYKTNRLGIKGVSEYQPNRFVANICKDGRVIRLGTFSSSVDAKNAYDLKANELFGQFARS